ncbi:MAG: flagellar assembly protein FliW [Deltaproteobacteria bacterium]|nr:flagellar assembly protein FliW [Deltaproteobacteria bacterium]
MDMDTAINQETEILVKSIYYPEGVKVEKTKIIEFVKPILGFDSLKKYCILNIDKEKNLPFFILQSIENEGLCFIVADPNHFFKDYAAAVTEEEKELLNLMDKTDAILFVIVTVFKDLFSSTVNLKAPIIINKKTRKAVQTVLNNDLYSVKQKLR